MKLIIFDIDNTLIKAVNGGYYYFFQTFENLFHVRAHTMDLSQYEHLTDSAVLNDLFLEHFNRLPTSTEITRLKQHYIANLEQIHQRYKPAYRAVKGASDAFQQLKMSPEWMVSIATGNWYEAAVSKLNFVGIDIWDVVGAFAQKELTTKAQLLEFALTISLAQNNGIPFEKVVYIGSSIKDYKACEELNIAFIGISESAIKRQYLELSGATMLKDFSNFDAFLQALHWVYC